MTMLLEIAGLCKRFGPREVLRGIDISVDPGEIHAIVGPSGAGKTTLLRCISFLTTAESGAVRYDGAEAPEDSAGRLALRRRIGFVAQNPLLFRGTAAYNVSYGLCVRGVEDPENKDRTLAALDSVGLGGHALTRAAALSAGEAQRVAFARAVVVRPDLVLLDEFTANLDPANVNILEGAVRAYNRETSAAVVLVTHNLFQAKRLAHRVGLLLDGQIVEDAPAKEFFESPRDPRTAAFVRGDLAY